MAECEFKPQRMRAALSSTMMATDLADYLARKGATFREAHGAVGGLIRKCEEEKLELHTLPLAAFDRLFQSLVEVHKIVRCLPGNAVSLSLILCLSKATLNRVARNHCGDCEICQRSHRKVRRFWS